MLTDAEGLVGSNITKEITNLMMMMMVVVVVVVVVYGVVGNVRANKNKERKDNTRQSFSMVKIPPPVSE